MTSQKASSTKRRNIWQIFLEETQKISFWKRTALILSAIVILTQVFDVSITPKVALSTNSLIKQSGKVPQAPAQSDTVETGAIDTALLTKAVLPEEGVILPIVWGDLGKRMTTDGVIDEQKFRALFEGGLNNVEEQMLSGNNTQPIVLNGQNSRYLLDLLWAFGLANKNDILENGEMTDEQYGGAGNFASTGGWSLSKGVGFDHYSQHAYVTLSPEQQALVDKVSRGIFRPCCGNSTHFPDCNHGMAMLGLLELMAKNNVSEQEMYNIALKVNSFWFPQTYIDLATYFKEQGHDWDQVDAKTVLGTEYSSAQGYQQTRQQIRSLPKPQQGGGGCGA
ncbi:MAG: hypothetical protein ABIJ33_01245 [Patescibacteria group bacterium]|nr:hypothetical protein [Patescibacteria group bacterium]